MNLSSEWQPFEPSEHDRWDLNKVAHLHRRVGFGASWSTLQRDIRDGPQRTIARIMNPPPEVPSVTSTNRTLSDGVIQGPDRAERLQAYWLNRLLFHHDVLTEKMTLFWHDHFATSNSKVRDEVAMLQQNQLFRKHATGDFRKLVSAVLRDPAMLVWLDGVNTTKQNPNENLGRELLELFTLGEGNYAEGDVRAASRALTGWVQQPSEYGTTTFRFDASNFDDSEKTFLGQTGKWGPDDIVRLTLAKQECGEFLCRKLYRFFVSDTEPSAELINPLAAKLRASDYSIAAIVETIVRSKHFYSRAVIRSKISSPAEFVVGFVRTLEISDDQIQLLALSETCRHQGQHLFHPPNVAGWPGGNSWLNTSTVTARNRWLTDMIWGNRDSPFPNEPLGMNRWMFRNRLKKSEVGSTLIRLMVQDHVSDDVRQIILEAARSKTENSFRKAVQIIAQCPEYHLI